MVILSLTKKPSKIKEENLFFRADDQSIENMHMNLIRLDLIGCYTIFWPESDSVNTNILNMKWR